MLKKIKPNFENYWLNMLDSVEDNLRCWRQTHARQPADLPGNTMQNEWLNCAGSVDRALEQLLQQGQILEQQAAELSRRGMLPGRLGGVVARFQALGVTLAQQSASAANREIYQEYQQLADHIMPTLARINQRVEARREAVGITTKTQAEFPAADETLDVALRAALKRRV